MKKLLKFSAIALIIFALVSNVYSSLFSYYGIKSNSLPGQVWAQSTSTSDDDEDPKKKHWIPSYYDVPCGEVNYTLVTYKNSENEYIGHIAWGPNNVPIVSLSGGTTSGASSTMTSFGTRGAFTGTAIICPPAGNRNWCEVRTAAQACE